MKANRRVAIGGRQVAVLDEGRGPPILFVHGFPLDHTMWDGQRSACSGYRMIAPDLRGFGDSEASEGAMTMAEFAEDLHSCLDLLGVGESVVYVGLSMGGYIAWPFMQRRPERAKALVLANTRVVADTSAGASTRRENANKVLTDGVQAIESGMLATLFSETTKRDAPNVVEKARSMIRRAKPNGVAAALLGMAERPDVSDRISVLSIPTLVIAGAEDSIISGTEMEGFARAIPNAEFVRVERAGHMTPMENASEFNGALTGFLHRVTGR